MADAKEPRNGQTSGDDASEAGPSVRVAAQYVKDLSFENPNVLKLLAGPGESPHLQLEVNVNAEHIQQQLFESAIHFKAQATSKAGVIYDLECVYAGLFEINGIPKEHLEPFLLINCPTLLFPFLRRLVADLTREGGFPPLMLDPMDFGQLYMRRQQELATAGTQTGHA